LVDHDIPLLSFISRDMVVKGLLTIRDGRFQASAQSGLPQQWECRLCMQSLLGSLPDQLKRSTRGRSRIRELHFIRSDRGDQTFLHRTNLVRKCASFYDYGNHLVGVTAKAGEARASIAAVCAMQPVSNPGPRLISIIPDGAP
jgi:hypothetical protein